MKKYLNHKNLIAEVKISLEKLENKIDKISQKTNQEVRNGKYIKIRVLSHEVQYSINRSLKKQNSEALNRESRKEKVNNQIQYNFLVLKKTNFWYSMCLTLNGKKEAHSKHITMKYHNSKDKEKLRLPKRKKTKSHIECQKSPK